MLQMKIILSCLASVIIIRAVGCYGFYCHDIIAELTWMNANGRLIAWLCQEYNCCNVEDMKTLAALPDLQKHDLRFIKYFPLHFYNNNLDYPPAKCELNYATALFDKKPNLIKAIDLLLGKLKLRCKLSFNELSYFIHFLSDLHQPLHVTGFQRGGLEKKLCFKYREVCFSLHALWDAELHKTVNLNLTERIRASRFDLASTVYQVNRKICELYDIEPSDWVEKYAAKFAPLAAGLIKDAVSKILWLLQWTLEMDSFNTVIDFEREIYYIIKSIDTTDSTAGLESRIRNLNRQFNAKSAFLSGYQLKSLKEKLLKMNNLILSRNFFKDSLSVSKENEIVQQSVLPELNSMTAFSDNRYRIADVKNIKNQLFKYSGDLIVEHVENSTLHIDGGITSLALSDVVDSTINASCSGSINVFNCHNSTIQVYGHQIRIHDCSNTIFYISCESGCIVEDCNGLSFGPINVDQDIDSWKCVQDFTCFDKSSFTYI